jgi:sugar phosphate isomerase/epimerase
VKLGFVSAILPELSLAEVLEFAAGEGFAVVELMCWPVGKADRKYAGVTHIDAAGFSRPLAEEVKELLARHGVGISALGYYPNLLAPERAQGRRCAAHLEKVIEAARLLGVSTVNTFIGADPRKNVEENFAAFRRLWPPIVRFAEKRGVRLAIENCPMLFTFDEWPGGKNLAYSPSIWRRIFDAIPSRRFGLNFDPSHLVWQFVDYIAPLAEFRDRLFHVHAKDTKVDQAKLRDQGILALGWQAPKIPGYGDVDWDRFFSALSDAGYDGPVCIEVEDQAFGKALAGRKRALKVARRALERYFAD